MNALHPNPFKFGIPVEGEHYLARPYLAKIVRQFVENGIPVVLIGPRRFGKTSFVSDLLKELTKQSYHCFFIDILSITSHRDFLQQMVRALQSKKSWAKKLVELLPKLRPTLSTEIDPTTGFPSFGLTIDSSSPEDVKEMIQTMLAGLGNLGDRVVIAIDEFQKVSEIDDQHWLETILRTYMQQLKNCSFLFTGSRKSIIYDMLNNCSRPFYRSCQPIEFPAFGSEFTEWVIEKFAKVSIQCSRDAVELLRRLVQETPNYVQMVCFHLAAQDIRQIGLQEIQQGLMAVVSQNCYAYQTLLESLTPMQQRILRLAAKEKKQIFSKKMSMRYEISSGPALASAIHSLKKKGILDSEGSAKGAVVFDDPLFAFWLQMGA